MPPKLAKMQLNLLKKTAKITQKRPKNDLHQQQPSGCLSMQIYCASTSFSKFQNFNQNFFGDEIRTGIFGSQSFSKNIFRAQKDSYYLPVFVS